MIQQFGESLESRWYREHSIKAHRRHLREISLRSKSTIRSPGQTKLVKLRKLSQELDKQREIERENFLLFLRLNSIKERKVSPRESYGPRSLNISNRRKDAERIMNENYSYVKRFIEMPSFVSAERHLKDFELQQNYKKTISKANLHQRLVKLSSFVAKPGLLPPLDISISESDVKVRSQNDSKLENPEEKEKKSEKSQKSEKNKLVELKKQQKKQILVDVLETQVLENLAVERIDNYEDEQFEDEGISEEEDKSSVKEGVNQEIKDNNTKIEKKSLKIEEKDQNPEETLKNPRKTPENIKNKEDPKEEKPLNPVKNDENHSDLALEPPNPESN